MRPILYSQMLTYNCRFQIFICSNNWKRSAQVILLYIISQSDPSPGTIYLLISI